MPQTDGVGVMIRTETRSGKVGTGPRLAAPMPQKEQQRSWSVTFVRAGGFDAIRLRNMIRWDAFMPLLISEIKHAQVGCWPR